MARSNTRIKFTNLTGLQKAVRELLALQKEIKGRDWYHQTCKAYGIPTTNEELNGLPADHEQTLDEYEAMFIAFGELLGDLFHQETEGHQVEELFAEEMTVTEPAPGLSPQPECEAILAKHTDPKRRSFSLDKAQAIRAGWHPDATQAEKDEAVATVLHEFGPAKHLSRGDASWLLQVIFTA
jgi:hypothetical protein